MANLKTDSINTLNGFVSAEPLDNFGTAGVIITGIWSGTITFEGSLDGVNYVTIFAQSLGTGLLITTTTSNGQFLVNNAGLRSIRVKMTAYTSGTADIIIQANAAIAINRSISTIAGGSNGALIGNIGDRLKTSPSSHGLKSGGAQGEITLTTANTSYEAKVGANRLPDRKILTVTALDDMYWGYDNTVSSTNGTPLYKNQTVIFEIDPEDTDFQVWLVASSNSKNARITESP